MDFAGTAEVQALIKLDVGVPPESWGGLCYPVASTPHARAT
jgi:hypothetical protein